MYKTLTDEQPGSLLFPGDSIEKLAEARRECGQVLTAIPDVPQNHDARAQLKAVMALLTDGIAGLDTYIW